MPDRSSLLRRYNSTEPLTLAIPRYWPSFLVGLENIKRKSFQAVAMSVLFYDCTSWNFEKCLKKKLDGNYTRILGAIFNKSWKHPTKKWQLYSHLPSILWTIQDEQDMLEKSQVMNVVLSWTPIHGHTSVGWPAKTYIRQLFTDTGYRLIAQSHSTKLS